MNHCCGVPSSAQDTKISRNCLLLSNRKPETVGGDEAGLTGPDEESGVITRMVSLLYSVRWCGVREGNLSELLRSRHSYPNILGTNPDQFYLNTIRRVDQDYCIVMVITRKTQSGNISSQVNKTVFNRRLMYFSNFIDLINK